MRTELRNLPRTWQVINILRDNSGNMLLSQLRIELENISSRLFKKVLKLLDLKDDIILDNNQQKAFLVTKQWKY